MGMLWGLGSAEYGGEGYFEKSVFNRVALRGLEECSFSGLGASSASSSTPGSIWAI